MTDPELDELLRRYRAAGPPPALRARVLAAAERKPRAWPWLGAVAAMLAVVVGLQVATAATYTDLGRAVAGDDPGLDRFPALRAAVGDDELLRRLLDEMAALEQQERAASPSETVAPWQ